MVNVLSESNSLLNQFIAEVRDVEIQQDSMRFRENLVRLGEIFAYEISKTLEYKNKEVSTSLGISNVPTLVEYPVLAGILRAALPFQKGFLNFFDKSENAFLFPYRKSHQNHSFTVQVEYSSAPGIAGKTLILCDTMIATGSSMVLCYKELLSKGKPNHTHIATIVASLEGIDYLKKQLPREDVTIWAGAIDEELTAQSYIVPGLGDAGDLAFGKKI
ncbi:MAG: uracil phosphoribosyltransferase [Bacteroidota bacterium]|nr:uracil phosphoribosyltransferase [Bacteroidota bacterium]